MTFEVESDLAFQRRVLTRCYRLAQREDLEPADRLRQIRDATQEALERPAGDGEVIEQLKSMVRELQNHEVDVVVAQKEVGLAQAQLQASERARRELQTRLDIACSIDAEGVMAYQRFVDLGAVLLDDALTELELKLATRAMRALAKRVARALEGVERKRRGAAMLAEILEGA